MDYDPCWPLPSPPNMEFSIIFLNFFFWTLPFSNAIFLNRSFLFWWHPKDSKRRSLSDFLCDIQCDRGNIQTGKCQSFFAWGVRGIIIHKPPSLWGLLLFFDSSANLTETLLIKSNNTTLAKKLWMQCKTIIWLIDDGQIWIYCTWLVCVN